MHAMPHLKLDLKLIHFIAAFLCLWAAPASVAGPPEDFQYRSRIDLRTIDTRHVTLNTLGEVRVSDSASRVTNYRVGEQFQYHPRKELTLGVGYTFIDQDGPDSTSFKTSHTRTHRAEVEANPHLKLSEDVRLNWRMRFENRWIDHRGSWNPQLRSRPELVFAVHHAGPLEEVYVNNEVFYDLKTGRYAENRFVPAGVTFALGERARFRVNYLLDSVHTAQNWVNLHVLQTQFVFTLH